MQQRSNSSLDLNAVDMLIRALSKEMVLLRSHKVDDTSPDIVLTQMEEALYGLRFRKMLLSALN
jgi:hypothetical protein